MKKLFAVLLCALVLLSSLSVCCFAEYPVEGRDEPSVETAVENTIGKYIPTGKDVSDAIFKWMDTVRDALVGVRDYFQDMLSTIGASIQAVEWVPTWMK